MIKELITSQFEKYNFDHFVCSYLACLISLFIFTLYFSPNSPIRSELRCIVRGFQSYFVRAERIGCISTL